MDFQHEEGRIFATDEQGAVVAEITFPATDGVADINHTWVDPTLRGSGVAAQLVEAALAQIAADGNEATATCSYAAAFIKKRKGETR